MNHPDVAEEVQMDGGGHAGTGTGPGAPPGGPSPDGDHCAAVEHHGSGDMIIDLDGGHVVLPRRQEFEPDGDQKPIDDPDGFT